MPWAGGDVTLINLICNYDFIKWTVCVIRCDCKLENLSAVWHVPSTASVWKLLNMLPFRLRSIKLLLHAFGVRAVANTNVGSVVSCPVSACQYHFCGIYLRIWFLYAISVFSVFATATSLCVMSCMLWDKINMMSVVLYFFTSCQHSVSALYFSSFILHTAASL